MATNSPASSPYASAPDGSPPPPVVGDPLAVLARYEAAVNELRAALVDLEAAPSYLMLSDPGLGPVTAARVGSAVRDAADLWALLDGVQAAVVQVRRYQTEHGASGRHRAEIQRLLTERWVPVALTGSGGPTAATPPPPAGSPPPPTGPRTFTVAEALDGFRRRFDAVRSLVSEVNAVFLGILPRIDAARGTLTRLDGEVGSLGVPEPLIGRARQRAADLERQLVADPLAIGPDDGPGLDAAVAAAATQVASLRAGHDQLESDTVAAEELLASLRVLRAQAQAAAGETEAKVVNPQGLVRIPAATVIDGTGGLAERLDQVISRSAGGTWDQRRSLLDGWLDTARKLQAQLSRADSANRAPLARRDELRGLLRAYQAKMAAVGQAEDLELTALVDSARTGLYTAPSDLDRAAATIEDLARRLQR